MKLFHRHQWLIVAVRNLDEKAYRIADERHTTDFTRILERCQTCQKVRQRTIDGHWSAEELGYEAEIAMRIPDAGFIAERLRGRFE